ncbi:MAG: NPCBM/NEW2 domain-containing protein [Dehalococcoidia bacterium]
MIFAALASTLGCATTPTPRAKVYKHTLPPNAVRLETLDLATMDQGWGTPKAARSVDGNPLSIAGTVYEHGVGTHAYSEMVVDLKRSVAEFHAIVGVDDETGQHGSVVFRVLADGTEAARTDTLRGDGRATTLRVDLRGARELTLIVDDAGDGMGSDHADWAEAYFVLTPGATAVPEGVRVPPGPDPVIAVDRSPAPRIHAPRITGATPAAPFLFRIPATGEPPLTYAAENLPAGLVLDPDTGIITGALERAGETAVQVQVSNRHGTATSTLTIVGGRHKLALTPPMGWNSWNVWGTSVDDAKVRAAADWMVASGLADHGFQYINIDDAWEAGRDENGRILTNEKFPDMKALADYVHSKGLKLGIYSSPGPKTCAGYEGSYQHEFQDAQTYAEWGIDLLKYDWCSYGRIAADDSRAEYRKPYELMREALDACGRDIVYSICQYGMGNVWEWGADVGGNYWRTTGDIVDTWSSMSHIGFGQAELAPYAGPGHWNDPDMLVVGMVGWGPELHPSRLTKNEQVTHITLWSLLAAPLLIGCDLSQLDEFTLAILTNPEVLEVNQDPLGRQGTRVAAKGRTEVWARPLSDGTLAVGLFNRDRRPATVTAKWSDLGLEGPQPVRDLWQRADRGTFDREYAIEIPGHGAAMLKIGRPR